ncbi:SDR family oxidoreductase [Verticiella sediminum]|uniref:SDR family oxidoreductase n=1 Tax=Verticiella sediminum TaxID=1247510 RepID=A0A556AXK3_9BURK|nr:3-oxoacyl-ACP reductase [Verticiella sediminum]TSH97667.1 SDR family oxidoreductase [Verticiella sediminum]
MNTFAHDSTRIALVTGAAQGIGLSSAIALLRAGHHVVLSDRQPIDLAIVPAELRARASALVLDVADPAACADAQARIERELAPVTLLVNNAGISPKRPDGRSSGVLEVTADEWARVLEVNLTSVLRLCQTFLPGMQAQRHGRIVNVASLAGRTKSLVAGPSYMAAKAGVIGLTRAIAGEMGPHGITANCVAPGRILTEMAMQAGPEVNERYAAQIPVRRLGTPDEVGAAIAFLCSDAAGFVNGAIIDINGGFYMP